jgi:DNA primase
VARSYSTSNADRTDELLGTLQQRVESLVTGDEWKAALDFQARFHTYSFNNALLIALQRPDATFVGGVKSVWNKLGRHVRRGEKGIAILAPLTAKREDKETGEARYVFTGRYRTVYVFDVAQTEGEPLPATAILSPEELDGDAPEALFASLTAQARERGYVVEDADEDRLGRAKGMTIPAKWSKDALSLVLVKRDASSLQRTKTLVHELAHVALHCNDEDPFDYRSCRGQAEVEAESVAYIVCAALGLPTDDYSFPYVAGWAKGDMEVIKKTGQRVAKTARSILDPLTEAVKEAA